MTASSESTPTPAYLSGGPVPPYRTSDPTLTYQRTPVRTGLEKVRDVLICLACLCVVAITITTVVAALALGHALSQVGGSLDTPAPAVSCDPIYYNC